MPLLPLAPANQVGLDPLLLTDVRLAWNYKTANDRLTISSSWDIFNVFNRSSNPAAYRLNASSPPARSIATLRMPSATGLISPSKAGRG
jgi:hypothetical protein